MGSGRKSQDQIFPFTFWLKDVDSCKPFKNAELILSDSAVWGILFLKGQGLGPMSKNFLILLQRTGKAFTDSWLLVRDSDPAPVPNIETWSQFQPPWRLRLILQGIYLV